MAEDRKRAQAELDAAAAWEREHPSFFYLSGRYGLRPCCGSSTATVMTPGPTAVGRR